jgi:hypothetical protein
MISHGTAGYGSVYISWFPEQRPEELSLCSSCYQSSIHTSTLEDGISGQPKIIQNR